jgi:hypothetical protein
MGETRKVGKRGTENDPAILPIANSFEIFCLACQQHFSNSLRLSAISVLNNLTESQILNLLSIHKQCLYMDNFSTSLTQMGE